MPPTFINAYNSDYTTTGSTKSITVTTQPGDTLVVYGGGDTNGAIALTLATPTGNGVALTLLNSLVANSKSSAYIWSGVDATGGTNWTLSCTVSSSVPVWGFTCVVFRNAGGIGASSGVISSGVPSLGLTTVGNGSMVVVFNNDYGSIDGTSRTWDTVNGITPSAGNGLELTYTFDSTFITVYGAYYNNTGPIGTAITVGLSAPTGQTYSIVAAEVLGLSVGTVAWLQA